jgi:hypothetical protein
MLTITITPLVACGEIINELEKNDFKFDVRPMFLFARFNPLWQRPLRHLDIVSFSIFEDSEEPDFLHASIKLRDFGYSNLRTCYVVYFTFNCIRYYIGINIHTDGEYVSSIAGYFDESNNCHDTPVDCEINEEENTMTWIVPKDVVGNPYAGDQLEDVHASSFLILQRDCEAKLPIHLAKDIARPILRVGYSYEVQY